MIVCSKSSDTLLKGVVEAKSTMISKIETIIDSIVVDPVNFTPAREIYVVTSDDVKNVKVRNSFLEAMQNKHPDVEVMFIDKSGKSGLSDYSTLFSSFLVKPRKDAIISTFQSILNNIANKEAIRPKDVVKDIEEFQIRDELESVTPEETADDVINDSQLVSMVESQYEPTVKEPQNITLVDRIKAAENWANLTVLSNEVTSSKVIQELNSSNATYRQSEVYVSALKENILAIISNPQYSSEEQLNKVRAILHDKSTIKAKTNTILEQSVEEIIRALVDKSKIHIREIVDEYNEAIATAFRSRSMSEAPNVRLSVLAEERSRAIIELTTLDSEIKMLAEKVNLAVTDTVQGITDESQATSGSPILDSHLRVKFGALVPENLVAVTETLLSMAKESNEEFGKLSDMVNLAMKQLYRLLTYYKEETEVLADTIRFLKANKVEDTVIANTIRKKTRRLYISGFGYDPSTILYILSREQARNSNVVLFDFTGNDIWKSYGIKTATIDELLSNKDVVREKFLLVTSAYGQELDYAAIDKMMDDYSTHYDIVNIICDYVQEEIYPNFINDVISITYMVDSEPYSVNDMKNLIDTVKVENTGKRVVLYNYVANSVEICSELGVLDDLKVQLATVPPITNLRLCMLNRQDPYDVSSILDDCKEVIKNC